MAVYKIIEVGNKILRDHAKKVPKITPNILKLLDNMAETMYDAKGVGLAAPQVGVLKRVITVDAGDGLIELVNPIILKSEGHETDNEGCLSVPGTTGDVIRAAKVEVSGWDRTGAERVINASGLQARALQHEIDHLDGVLFIDRAINIKKI
ncbi:MAG: Peptide deformylase 1 [Pelotomaculum sp. PtaB.Bin104]|nr:MAG: Peptide deformylase 1 [Pelotomaculum sp. PtaB.Bin104]